MVLVYDCEHCACRTMPGHTCPDNVERELVISSVQMHRVNDLVSYNRMQVMNNPTRCSNLKCTEFYDDSATTYDRKWIVVESDTYCPTCFDHYVEEQLRLEFGCVECEDDSRQYQQMMEREREWTAYC